jgi:hypothetical protein
MAFYRCYNIFQDGRIIEIQTFDAPDDADACLGGGQIQSDGGWHSLEMWEGRRKVSCPPLIVRPNVNDNFKL